MPENAHPEFEALHAHAGFVRALARSLVADEDTARDLEQDTWLAALRSPPADQRSPRGWLATVLRNLRHGQRRTHVRRAHRERQHARFELTDPVEVTLAREALLAEIVEAVRSLDLDYRTVIILRYYEGLSSREIATRLEMPVETVRTRLKRAIVRLRAELDRRADGDRRQWAPALVALTGIRNAPAPTAPPLESVPTSTASTPSLVSTGALLMSFKAELILVTAVVVGLSLVFFWPGDAPTPPGSAGPAVADSTPPPSSSGNETEATPENPSLDAQETQVVAPVPHSLRGRVLDGLTGEPIVDAHVTLCEYVSFYAAPRVLARVVSGARGEYHFPRHRGARSHLVLRVEHRGYVPFQSDRNNWRTSQASQRDIYLNPGVTITGEVVFEGGAPAGAGIGHLLESLQANANASSPQGLPQARYMSRTRFPFTIDASGRFEVAALGQRVALEVLGETYASTFSEVILPRPGESTHVVVTVDAGVALRGTVRNAAGAGIAGARVLVFPAIRERYPDHLFFNHNSAHMVSATTTGDGTFVIPHLTPQYRSLTVECDGYISHSDHNLLEESGEPVEVTLKEAQRLGGRLVWPGDLAPPHGELHAGNKKVAIEVDETGTFETAPLPLDVARATLRVDGHRPIDLEWEPEPGTVDVGDVTLDPAGGLEVQVVDASGSAIGAAVVLTSVVGESGRASNRLDWTETDDDGRARVTGLEDGEITLSVTRVGYSPWTEPMRVQNAGSPITVELLELGEVRGQVLGVHGDPLRGAVVSARYPGPRPARWTPPTTSLADGGFWLRNVHPEIPVELRVSRAGHASRAVALTPLAPGEEQDVGTLQLDPGMHLRGRVVDGLGHAIEGAVVSAQKVETSFTSGMRTDPWSESDEAGEFRIGGLDAGPFMVVAALGGSRSPVVQANAGTDNARSVTLVIKSGARHDLVLVDPEGVPVTTAMIELLTPTRYVGVTHSDSRGRVTFHDVPDEALTLRINHDDFLDRELEFGSSSSLPDEITLEVGAILEIEIDVVGDRALPEYVRVNLRGKGANRSFGRAHSRGVIRVAGLPGGEVSVRLLADGFPRSEAVSTTLVDGDMTNVQVPLDGTTEPVLIEVLDSSGSPVEGARIRFASGRYGNTFFGHGTTDARGRFTSVQVHGPDVVLIVEAKGFEEARIDSLAERIVRGAIIVSLEVD